MFPCVMAVVEDGYGVCYNPREDVFLMTVSSWHSCAQTDSLTMIHHLQESLREMRDLLVTTGRVKTNAKL